jgi:hypothetical protein
MPLHKIRDFDPDYRQHFDDRDLTKFDVYSGNEKVGSVDDLLVDDSGQFRYLVVDTGAWIAGKKVLVPIGISRIDEDSRRLYVDRLTRDQVKSLPEYKGDSVDYDYEERVRNVYRPIVGTRGTAPVPASYDRTNYRYDRDPGLYNLRNQDHESLRHSEARVMSGRPIAGRHRRAVGVFPNRPAAEQAMHELRDSGFPMGRVSIITRDADKHDNDIAGAEVRDRVGNKADEGATIGAVSGGVLGGLTGLLVGLGTLAIPGVGPIMLAGATATTLATTLAGGAIGAVSGGLLGALIGLGIPEERARVYEDRIARGGYLVIVDGTDEDIARAESILHRRGIEEYGVYDAPAATAATTVSTVNEPRTAPIAQRSAVGFFLNLSDAEHAVTDLRSIGFPLSQITLVANNWQRRDRFAGVDLRDRFEAARLGIPTEQARLYHDRVGRGEYMVIAHGTEDELNRAAPILNRRGIQDWRIYDPTDVRNEAPSPTSTNVYGAPNTVPAASPNMVQENRTTPVGRRSAVGFFSNLADAEQAVAELRSVGFPLNQVTLVANNLQRRERLAGIDLRDRFEAARLGIPVEQERIYNDRLGRDEYMVVVHGTEGELQQASTILSRRRIQDWRMYDPGDRSTVPQTGMSTMPQTDMATTPSMLGRTHPHAVGFFPQLEDADRAIADLRSAGFPLSQVSLVGSRFERREPFAGVNLLDRLDNSHFGFPEERYRAFHQRVNRGDYLLVIHGTQEQLRQAEAILAHARIHDFGIYDASGMAQTSPTQEAVERQIAPDMDPTLRERNPRVDQSQPNVTIVDNRDETRL